MPRRCPRKVNAPEGAIVFGGGSPSKANSPETGDIEAERQFEAADIVVGYFQGSGRKQRHLGYRRLGGESIMAGMQSADVKRSVGLHLPHGGGVVLHGVRTVPNQGVKEIQNQRRCGSVFHHPVDAIGRRLRAMNIYAVTRFSRTEHNLPGRLGREGIRIKRTLRGVAGRVGRGRPSRYQEDFADRYSGQPIDASLIRLRPAAGQPVIQRAVVVALLHKHHWLAWRRFLILIEYPATDNSRGRQAEIDGSPLLPGLPSPSSPAAWSGHVPAERKTSTSCIAGRGHPACTGLAHPPETRPNCRCADADWLQRRDGRARRVSRTTPLMEPPDRDSSCGLRRTGRSYEERQAEQHRPFIKYSPRPARFREALHHRRIVTGYHQLRTRGHLLHAILRAQVGFRSRVAAMGTCLSRFSYRYMLSLASTTAPSAVLTAMNCEA